MADYGFAIIATDHAFVPGPGMRQQVEQILMELEVIGQLLPGAPESELARWTPGARAEHHIQGSPREISLYLGSPIPFFDGHCVVCNTALILETVNGDPTSLLAVLEQVLKTPLTVHPFRY